MTPMTCAQCGTRISDVLRACLGCGWAGHERDEMLERLQTYVGPNWERHYRQPFEALLEAQYTGARVDWTWNWAAALLFPFWLLYRRLYLACLGAFILYGLAGALSGSGFSGVFFVLLFFVQGWAGDRLLFDKAFASVGVNGDRVWLARVGKPLRLVVWGACAWMALPAVFAAVGKTELGRPEETVNGLAT
ncbi:MAG TPA: DUF2628 domain-containing protein, partial [Longimicrobium sp.]|nr:DUF2628 domain-containing protein [Longimicrobium sp.]